MSINDLIFRRISFILQEATYSSSRDQVITSAMRSVSNYASVGVDAQSFGVTKFNTKISLKALNSMADYALFSSWAKTVTNDHPEPLQLMWEWIVENCRVLSPNEIWNRFCEHPMITILRDENRKMDGNGFRAKGTYMERYVSANIEVVQLRHSAHKEWKLRRAALEN